MFNLNFCHPCIGTDSYLLFILKDTGLDLTVDCNDISSRGFMADLLKKGTYFFSECINASGFCVDITYCFYKILLYFELCHELEAFSPLMLYELMGLLP